MLHLKMKIDKNDVLSNLEIKYFPSAKNFSILLKALYQRNFIFKNIVSIA